MERNDNINAVKMRFEAEKMKLKEEREKTFKQYWENLPKINNLALNISGRTKICDNVSIISMKVF